MQKFIKNIRILFLKKKESNRLSLETLVLNFRKGKQKKLPYNLKGIYKNRFSLETSF